MQLVEKKVLVAHTPAQMFALVDDVEHYPRFLPWCGKAEVTERGDGRQVASLTIDYLKIRQRFTTCNTVEADRSIEMNLVDGPFEMLRGNWLFIPLGEIGCKIEFSLRYQFSSSLLEKVIGPVFGHISASLVDAFIKEADRIYGDE
jgi:ribosome-associated toxin RatA of RatAB toxin-antitoxin module